MSQTAIQDAVEALLKKLTTEVIFRVNHQAINNVVAEITPEQTDRFSKDDPIVFGAHKERCIVVLYSNGVILSEDYEKNNVGATRIVRGQITITNIYVSMLVAQLVLEGYEIICDDNMDDIVAEAESLRNTVRQAALKPILTDSVKQSSTHEDLAAGKVVLRAVFDGVTATHKDLLHNYIKLSADNNELKHTISTLEARCAEYKATNEALDVDNNKLDTKLAHLAYKNTELLHEICCLRQHISSIEGHVSELRAELKSIEGRCIPSEKIQALRTLVERHRDDNSRLHQTIADNESNFNLAVCELLNGLDPETNSD